MLPAGRNSETSCLSHSSATARMFSIEASRPSKIPVLTTRRRSSVVRLSARTCAIASQSRAAKCAMKRSATWPAAFSNRGVGRLSSSNRASAVSRADLIEYLSSG